MTRRSLRWAAGLRSQEQCTAPSDSLARRSTAAKLRSQRLAESFVVSKAIASRTAASARILKRREQLSVQVGVGVEPTSLIARMSSGSIGEVAPRFLDEKNPRRVVPDVAALG